MPRIRRLLIFALLALLALLPAVGVSAEEAIRQVDPKVETDAKSYTLRPGLETDMTLTLSMPGFLTVRALSADEIELETVCTDVEFPSGKSVFSWNGEHPDGSFYDQGEYKLGFTLRDEYGNVSAEKLVKIEVGEPRPVVSNVSFSNENAKKPWTFDVTLSVAGSVRLDIFRTSNLQSPACQIDVSKKAEAGDATIAWDGELESGDTLAPGDYAVRVVLIDKDDVESLDELVYITVVEEDKSVMPYLTGSEPTVETEDGDPDAAESDSDDEADRDTADDEEEKKGDSNTAIVLKPDVNLRAKPTTDSVRILFLDKNDVVTVLDTTTAENGELWYHVYARSGYEGYVRGDLLELQ